MSREKKKLLKYLRERVRRAKKAKDEKAIEESQQSLDMAFAEQEERIEKKSVTQQHQPDATNKESNKRERKDAETDKKEERRMFMRRHIVKMTRPT
jgi:hypothetical protein